MSNEHNNGSLISADVHVGNLLNVNIDVGNNGGGGCDSSHQGALIAANVDLGCNGLDINADVGGGDCGSLLSVDIDIGGIFGHDGCHSC